jgi:signal transduction histidine kinase/ketosteroid isomerase-like protein
MPMGIIVAAVVRSRRSDQAMAEPTSRLLSLVDREFAAYNARDLDAYQALLHPQIDFVMSGVTVGGITAVMDLTRVVTESSPSLWIERRQVFAEVGDTIVIELRMVDGVTPDPATGIGPAQSTACALYRIVGDRIAEFRVYHDPVAEDLAWAAVVEVAAEQSALRRVAESVARRAPAEQIFELVTDELSRLLAVDLARTVRFESDDTVTVLASRGASAGLPPGTTVPIPAGSLVDAVLRTGRSARFDRYQPLPGPVGAILNAENASCAAGGPIMVDGRVWGAMIVAFSGRDALPAGIEARVAQFAELVSTAISNVAAHERLSELVAEQTALRRVATLVAREHSPEDLFAAVAQELGELLDVDAAAILRYGSDASATAVAEWSNGSVSIELGARMPLDGDNLASRVLRTGTAQRKEDYSAAAGQIASTVRRHGIRSAVASPIVVQGETWGVIAVLSRASEPLPPSTESRLAEFSRHAGMAVANANSRAELARSRARIVRAADEARRRLERDLHDGAQQRLVSLSMELSAAESRLPDDPAEPHQVLADARAALRNVLEDLRELSRGLHPTALSEGGLGAALRSLSRRSAIPVELALDPDVERLPETVEVAAYFTVSEALTNAVKHAGATRVDVSLARSDRGLHLTIADDGKGGADPAHGSGLTGLADRVEAIGGTLRVDSPRGSGTTLTVQLPTAVVG